MLHEWAGPEDNFWGEEFHNLISFMRRLFHVLNSHVAVWCPLTTVVRRGGTGQVHVGGLGQSFTWGSFSCFQLLVVFRLPGTASMGAAEVQ